MKSIPFEEKLTKILKRKKKTLAAAESCTGGLISSRITDVSGSSDYFTGGVIAYSNEIKVSILGVSTHLIKKHGAVSRLVAEAMAKGARNLLNTDFAVSITGIAGPTGGSELKPVGLAYIGFSVKGKQKSKKVLYKGDRKTVKSKFTEAALKFVTENI